MQFSIPKGPFCQSCYMPMETEDKFGINKDGSKNADYCCYCYQKGEFTEPNLTLAQMSEKVTKVMQEMHLPQFVISQVIKYLPTLKRWA